MRWVDLLWLPPVMVAVALVLGATGRRGVKAIGRAVLQTLLALTVGVLLVGAVIHVVAEVFS